MKKPVQSLILAISILLCPGAEALKAQGDFNLSAVSAAEIKAGAASGQKALFSPSAPLTPKPLAPKEWTVMVFMNAKNDLSESRLLGLSGNWGARDLDEMKKVGTTGTVNVAVEYGAAGQGSRRMLIGKAGVFSSGETVYGRYPKADMGDYKRVIEFVNWAKTNFPARKYMFILWGHGKGWLDPDLSASAAGSTNKGILFDDETNNYVRTRQLGMILRAAGYVDVFATNSCLMQMAEVAYEVKDGAGLIVASEERMQAQGFDYEKLLNFLNAEPGAADERLSDHFIRSARDFYASGVSLAGLVNLPLDSIPGTLSTLRSKALGRLPFYLDAFAGAVMRNGETQAVKAAVSDVIRFTGLKPDGDPKKMLVPYVDLYDFARIVNVNAAYPETRRAAVNLMTFIKSDLVMRNFGVNYDRENGYDYSTVGGIAINMTMKAKLTPRLEAELVRGFETIYSDLALSKASRWDEFMTWTDAVWRGKFPINQPGDFAKGWPRF